MNINEKLSLLIDNEHPLSSPNTHAVAAALTSGGNLADQGYLDTIEEGAGGNPRRTVVWLLKDSQIEFKATPAETISQAEFLRRWNDREWLRSNPDHPIAFIRAYQDNLSALRTQIRECGPTIKVTRGGRSAFIPAKASDAERAKLLSKL